jgi:hypothetical protein
MPLQSSGAISFSQIRGEFGGAGVTRMGQLYVNAGIVPNDSFVTNGTIPASGPIRFSNFYTTTNGNTYVDFYSTQNYTPPVNTVRFQTWIIAAGGGPASNRFNVFSWALAAGGGGGYTYFQGGMDRNAGQYLNIVVGGGGAYQGGDGPRGWTGTAGGSSATNIYVGSTLLGGGGAVGGGGGYAAPNTGSSAGGAGGFGNIASGGNGGRASIVYNVSTFSAAGGSSGTTFFGAFGKGGSVTRTNSQGAITPEQGQNGYVRVRI